MKYHEFDNLNKYRLAKERGTLQDIRRSMVSISTVGMKSKRYAD